MYTTQHNLIDLIGHKISKVSNDIIINIHIHIYSRFRGSATFVYFGSIYIPTCRYL